MSRGIVVFGATSTIARQILLQLVEGGDRVCVAARNTAELSRVATDLRLRRSPTSVYECLFDTGRPETHPGLIERVWKELGGVDIAIACTGELGDQERARHDPPAIHRIAHSNYTGIATAIAPMVDLMETQGRGVVAVLSSVAGDRARQSNYIYGSAKAGIDSYFAGLRNRLHGTGVSAITFKLGFTDTRMVYGKSGMFLVASPALAARAIVAGLQRGSGVVYVPWFWRYIMFIIRAIPSVIFNRLRL